MEIISEIIINFDNYKVSLTTKKFVDLDTIYSAKEIVLSTEDKDIITSILTKYINT